MNKPFKIKRLSVNTNDIFITERQSFASLFFREKSRVRVEPNARNNNGFKKIIFSLK